MTSSIPAARHAPVALQASTRTAFFIAGLALAAWAPLVPFAKARSGVNDASLGLLLLSLGVGSILTMPLTGSLAARFGCRIVITGASLLICLALPFLATLSDVPGLAIALFVFGAGVGTVDVAVNIQAVIVEKAAGRAMMSGFHGFFSIGGIVGAAGVSGLLSLGLTPLLAVMVAVALILLLLAAFARNLLPSGCENSGDPLFALPRGKVILIGVLCFICFLAEGAMLDWSALFLTTLRGVNATHAGLGYAAFAVAMTLGRLYGDKIVRTLGRHRVLLGGGVCSALGLGLAVLAPSAIAALIGFTLVGLGASNMVPVLFSAAGSQQTMPSGLAIAAITTIGYAGILAGPAAIGFLSQATNLSVALGAVALGLLLVAAAAKPAVRE